jgi:hypothetical protein
VGEGDGGAVVDHGAGIVVAGAAGHEGAVGEGLDHAHLLIADAPAHDLSCGVVEAAGEADVLVAGHRGRGEGLAQGLADRAVGGQDGGVAGRAAGGDHVDAAAEVVVVGQGVVEVEVEGRPIRRWCSSLRSHSTVKLDWRSGGRARGSKVSAMATSL